MRVGVCQLVLPAVLLTMMLVSDSVAESTPWFDSFLLTFPDALRLEREPTPSPAPSATLPGWSEPWFDGLLNTFPNALLLERMPHDHAVPSESAPAPLAAEVTSPVATVETHPVPAQNENPPLTASETVDHQPEAPGLSPESCTCSSHRRWIFPEGNQCSTCEYWQILPDGILFPSYVAGEKEPRMAFTAPIERDRGAIFEATIGGRMGMLRYGTPGPINPQGWQWDLESAAFLRQDPEEELDVEAVDFRIGSVLTWRRGRTQLKGGFYHLSSHVGDEFLERNPDFQRLNYSRDVLLVAVRHFLTSELDVYGEIGVSVRNDGGSEPLELQFGAEYTSVGAVDPCGAPFAAINAHLREEFDFGGSLNVLAGWEWRGPTSNRRLRIGGQFYTGKEIQWSFFDEDLQFTGAGIWYDF